MLDKIVYSSIAVGLTLAGAGIAYVISFEGRLSKLETQIGFISGASSAPNSKLAGDEKSQGIQNSTISAPFFESEKINSAIANGCSNYMATYNKIVSAGTLYNSEETRLKALTDQMQLLGCDKVLK